MGLVTFICNDCNSEFDDPKCLTDWVEFWGQNVPMYSYVCPFCESEDFDEKDKVEKEDEEMKATTLGELLNDYDNGIIHVVEDGEIKEGQHELENED